MREKHQARWNLGRLRPGARSQTGSRGFRTALKGLLNKTALLLVVAVLAACSAQQDKPDPVEQVRSSLPRNPCTLIRPAELEAPAGAVFQKGTENIKTGTPPPIPVVGMRFCLFKSQEQGGPIVQVGVVEKFAAEAFNKVKADPQMQPLTPVEGLGDEALYRESATLGWVLALDGEKAVGVHLSFVKTNLREAAEDLALLLLEKV